MKKILILAIMMFMIMPVLRSQDPGMVFNSNECTWLGLDFSKAKMIGSEGFTDPYQIKNRFFDSWNQLFLSEAEKYNIGETFRKDQVTNYLDVVKKRNEMVNIDDLVIDHEYNLTEDDIKSMVGGYDLGDNTGLGLVFIVEAFDKNAEEGRFWVTFIDNDTKQVLLTKKLEGKAGGFGLRNYWAKSYYNVLKEIDKKQYKRWRAEYMGKK